MPCSQFVGVNDNEVRPYTMASWFSKGWRARPLRGDILERFATRVHPKLCDDRGNDQEASD